MKPLQYLWIAVIALASCGGEEKKSNAEQLLELKKERAQLDEKIAKLESQTVDTNKKPAPVVILELQSTPFIAYIEVQSQIVGDENVYASAQAPGTVTNVMVSPGQYVSKGQVLATLDAAAIEQQIESIESQLELLKSLYERQQKLWAQNIGTEVQLMSAKTNYESTKKQKSALEAQRNMYRIVAPIAGVVDAVDAKVGQASNAAFGGIRIVNNAKLKAEASLGENYLGKVKAGDAVTLILPDINDSIHTKLNFVSQAVDPISRAFNAEVRLGSDKRLYPNMSCKMKIANYENKAALVVPVSIIQKTSEGDMIYIAESNKAKSVIITTGKNSNGMVEVLSGLKEGDKVITEGFRELNNGEEISIQ